MDCLVLPVENCPKVLELTFYVIDCKTAKNCRLRDRHFIKPRLAFLQTLRKRNYNRNVKYQIRVTTQTPEFYLLIYMLVFFSHYKIPPTRNLPYL